MCGLVGMAGDLSKDDRELFRHLLIVDSVRGLHSTGVAAVTAKKKLSVFKKAWNPYDLMSHNKFDKTVEWDSQVLMGHNRFATVGAVNDHTAHPFTMDHITGAHNGTLEGWRELPDSNKFGVDSECLLHNISAHGWEETIKKVRGAFALSVYDQNEHILQLCRNEERPLWVAKRLDGQVVYWASEAWMLRNMAARRGIKLQKEIWQPEPNTLVTFKLPTVKFNNEGIKEPVIEPLEVPEEKKSYPPAARTTRITTGGKGTTNITRIKGGYRDWNGPLVGDRVEFIPVQKIISDRSGAAFLEGITVDDPFLDVRVYGLPDIRVDRIVAEGFVMDGECRAIVDPVGKKVHLVLNDMQEVYEDVHEPIDPNVQYVPGPAGKMITPRAFLELAKHGCGFCGDDLDTADEVEWVGDSPVCMDCHGAADKLWGGITSKGGNK